MQQTIFNVEFRLDEDQAARLQLLSAREGSQPDDIARKALNEYLVRHPIGPQQHLPDPAWQEHFDRAVQDLRSTLPADLKPEEIEAEITLASAELRRERQTHRRA